MDFFECITEEEKEKQESQESQDINEGLIDVMFNSFRTTVKTFVAGPVVTFKWLFVPTKTVISISIRKDTLANMYEWLGNIVIDVDKTND